MEFVGPGSMFNVDVAVIPGKATDTIYLAAAGKQ